MKVVAKPIEVVAWFQDEGNIKPLRFRLKEDGEEKVIKIDRVITKELEKLAGNLRIVFNCISEINGIERPYQIKYELGSCKWILFKI